MVFVHYSTPCTCTCTCGVVYMYCCVAVLVAHWLVLSHWCCAFRMLVMCSVRENGYNKQWWLLKAFYMPNSFKLTVLTWLLLSLSCNHMHIHSIVQYVCKSNDVWSSTVAVLQSYGALPGPARAKCILRKSQLYAVCFSLCSPLPCQHMFQEQDTLHSSKISQTRE